MASIHERWNRLADYLPTLLGIIVAAVFAEQLASGRSRLAAARAMPSGEHLAPGSSPPAAPAAEARAKATTLLQIGKNVFTRIGKHNLTLVAAGVAFYTMTAIFPAIAAFVSIYGLFADPATAQHQIGGFSGLLPAASLKLLTDALQAFAGKSSSTLNLALLISIVVALWSAKAGVQALMTGLNIANEQEEERSFVMQQAVAIALTIGAIIFAMVALAAVAILPAVINVLPVNDVVRAFLSLGRWPLLAVLMCLGLAVLYRFAPCRRQPKWRWITWGAAIGTVLWIAGSAAFSFYVSRFGSYDVTYGALAAPVSLLLWFWISALVVLVGAEIDAELQHGDGQVARAAPITGPGLERSWR